MAIASAKISDILKEAQSLRESDPKRAELLCNQILQANANGYSHADGIAQDEWEQNLRDQETALVLLGELCRDTKYDLL